MSLEVGIREMSRRSNGIEIKIPTSANTGQKWGTGIALLSGLVGQSIGRL
jgi:hypothetical protein